MRIAQAPLTDPAWREFTGSHPAATPFHLPEWAALISECYGFPAFALVARNSGNEIVAGLPVVAVRSPLGGLRWVSLPYSDACELLVRADVCAEDFAEALGRYVLDGPADRLDVRGKMSASPLAHPIAAGYQHVIEIPSDPKDLKPRKSHRHSRNRAGRIGVTVTRGITTEDVATFYRLQTLTRRRHGVPVQPRRFFDLLGERLLTNGRGFVSTAWFEGAPVASALFIGHNGTLVAKYGASDPNRSDLGAGHLVDWDSMVLACEQGYHSLDLGRTDLGADGLRHYKTSWGAVERDLVYTQVSEAPPVDSPVRSTGAFVEQLIRRSPLWVCRGLGEVFYRWSA